MNKLRRLPLMIALLFAADASQSLRAQVRQTKSPTGGANLRDQGLIERGKYIVESVAMCERCHTQRDENGTPDRTHWLQGGPTQTQPTYPAPKWAVTEPRIARSPPGTDAEFVTLLTTGISRNGKPPDPPMPSFRMTRGDAEAVLAYLKSLR